MTVAVDGQLRARLESRQTLGPTDTALDELMAEKLTPLRYLVHGLLPEGATLLFSPGKIGKSFFAGALALSVANGADFFGHPTDPAGVEYLDLEVNRVMAQNRWRTLLAGQAPPRRMRVAFAWPRMDRQGLDQIAKKLDQHPEIGLVIVDVLSLFWPLTTPTRGSNAYHAEYEIYSRLNHFGMERHVAVLMVHHTGLGRATAKDPFSRASGTSASLGGPNASWYLERKRGSSEGLLHVTGRCVPESKIELTWNPRFGGWCAAEGRR